MDSWDEREQGGGKRGAGDSKDVYANISRAVHVQ